MSFSAPKNMYYLENDRISDVKDRRNSNHTRTQLTPTLRDDIKFILALGCTVVELAIASNTCEPHLLQARVTFSLDVMLSREVIIYDVSSNWNIACRILEER